MSMDVMRYTNSKYLVSPHDLYVKKVIEGDGNGIYDGLGSGVIDDDTGNGDDDS